MNPTVHPLYEGPFSVGMDNRFIRIDKEAPPAKGALKLSITPFLIRTGDRNLLLDAGMGDFGEDTSSQSIRDNLQQAGLTEHDITDIFISHLHFDHFGGLANNREGYLELSFPNARIWVNGNDWERTMEPANAPADHARDEFLHFLDARADLNLLEEEDQPYPDVRVRQIGGHTPFSQVIFFENGDSRYLMAGDVIGQKRDARKKYQAKYDYDPEKTMEMREELKKLALEEDYIILTYHEAGHPLFRLTENLGARGYLTEDV